MVIVLPVPLLPRAMMFSWAKTISDKNYIIGGRGRLDGSGGQIRIAEIEICGSAFDLGHDQLLDGIES